MAISEKPTAEIIAALQKGSACEENFTSLCERYYRRVFDFFRKKGNSVELAKDLTQEVFFSVYRGLGALRDVNKFEHWLYKIAKHTHWSGLKEPGRTPRGEPWPKEPGEVPVVEGGTGSRSAGNPEQAILDKERLSRFQEVWQCLPDQRRHCLKLRVEGFSYDQIGSILGIGAETVRTHLRLARVTLREQLASDNLVEEDLGR